MLGGTGWRVDAGDLQLVEAALAATERQTRKCLNDLDLVPGAWIAEKSFIGSQNSDWKIKHDQAQLSKSGLTEAGQTTGIEARCRFTVGIVNSRISDSCFGTTFIRQGHRESPLMHKI